MSRTVLLNGSLAPSLINFCGPLIADMIRRGHRVHVSAPEIPWLTADQLTTMGAVVHEVPLARDRVGVLGDVRYLVALWRLIRRIGADYVIGYTIKPNIYGSLAARLAGTRSASMVTGLGYAFIKGDGKRRRLIQRIARGLYRPATSGNDKVIFLNPDDVTDFAAAGCLADRSKARLVDGSGVDVDHFALAPLPAEPVFLMISRYLWTKGLREYAGAALQLREERPGWRFLLVGMGAEGPDAIPEAEVQGWADQGLEVLGELRDVRPALRQASVYVLPSYREGIPRSVCEAMAMGRPVITTDAPGCRETVRDGDNGLLVAVGDVPALVAAMRRLGEEPAARAAMGAAGRRIAEERYAVDLVNRALLGHLGL